MALAGVTNGDDEEEEEEEVEEDEEVDEGLEEEEAEGSFCFRASIRSMLGLCHLAKRMATMS